jgi:PKD repeat protein
MRLLTMNQWGFLCSLFIIFFSQSTSAQGVVRCYTDEMDALRRQNNPELESKEAFEQWMNENETFNQNALIIGGVYQIPVVVHVIHNGEAIGTQTNISFAAIQSQIDVLNEDFRKIFGTPGYNSHPSGADSEIEFCLAQRRPDGSAFPAGEPGVNRINRTTAGFTAPPFTTNYIDATIKPWTYNGGVPTATRGWSPDRYLNIWVCNISGGILGYAQFPETPLGGMGCGGQNVATDGVVFLYNSLGKSAETGFPGPYNEGRTATHEIGHWLGLRHIWGDGGCTVDDFCNDTPLAGAANYGCPTGTNSCNAAPDAGVDMIENYMDYTDDLCMNIFTNDQKMRMRIVLEASPRRALLITSDACVPPNPSDAAVVNILNPVGDNCVGSITPSVVLRNRGSNNLTSATINYSVDNGAVTTFAWTGSLTPGSSATVSLPAFTSVLGNHAFKSWNTLPNGIVDPSPSLDTSSIGFVVSNGIEAPYAEDFDGGVFPPDIRWVVNNPNGDCYEWLGAAATSITGVLDNAAAQMPAFGNNTGGTENLITPIFLLPCNATAANIQFDVSYRRRNNTTANYERLYVEISENCGTTWNAVPIYDKTGTVLQTVTSTQTSYYTPTAGTQWRTETIDLLPFVTGTSKNVKFRIRAVAANGNNIYIDNFRFNATTPGEIDVTLSSVNILDGGYADLGSTVAGTPLVATFTVTNSGTTNLTLNNPITVTGTGYTLGSAFGSTSLAAGASTTFTVNFNSAVGGSFTGNVSFTNNDCDEGTFNFEMYCDATTNPPVADFTGTPTTVCAGSTVSFTNISTGANSYAWTFTGGTPASSTATNPTVTYNTPGTYTVSLVATNSFGSDTETKANYILVVDANGIALPISEGFTAATFVPAGWTLINNNTSPTTWARSATVGFAPTAGNSMVFDNFAYNDGDDDQVLMPGANFTGLVSASLVFDVAYARYDATYSDGLEVLVSSDCGVTYTSVYSKSGTVLATAPDVTTSFTPTDLQWRTETVDLTSYIGNSKIIVAFKNLSGYGNRLFVDNINLSGVNGASPPVASFTASPTAVCTGQTVTFTNTSTGSPTSYAWTFPGGTPASSTAANPTVTYAAAGTYDVTLIATNAAGSDTETQTAYITVSAIPSAPGSITGATTVCSGTTGNVYSITAVPGASSYVWTVPAGATITSGQGTTSATVTMGSTSGNISVTATNTCGTSSAASLALTINTAPAVPGAISGTSSLCSGTTGNVYSITAVPGATSYVWTVPSGATITAGQGTTSATVTMGSTSGNVSVTATNSCGTSGAATFAVSIIPTPTITLGTIVNPTACGLSNGSITVNGSGTGIVSWTGSAAGNSGSVSLPYTISTLTAGAYSISFSNGCTSNILNGSLVDPAAPAAPGISIVDGCGSSVLSATGAGLVWSTGATTTSITVTVAGTYSVTQNVGGCTSAAANITANPLSIPAITQGVLSNPSSCGSTDGSIVINGTGTGNVTWTGTVSGSASSVSLPYTITGLGAGSYSVVFNTGCPSNTISAVFVDPSAPSSPTVTVVDGCGSSVLTATGSNLLWSTNETTSSISVSTSGTYTVTQTISGCTSAPTSVTANPTTVPVISLGSVNDPSSCGLSDGSIVVNGSGIGNLSWSGSASGSANGVNLPFTISGLSAGNYSISFENGCPSNILSATVNGGSIPSAPVVTVVDNCGYSEMTASGSNLQWSTSETSSSITVTVAGTYFVSQTIGGCTSPVASITAAPLTIPTVSLTPISDVCINDPSFALSGGSPAGGTYSGTGVSAGNFDPSVAGFGTFLITYDFTDVNSCNAQAQQTITVGCAGVEENSSVNLSILPNPSNGVFTIQLGEEKMNMIKIIDQAGRIIDEIKLNLESEYSIDLSSQAEGIYSILIFTENGMFNERIVLAK